MASSIHIVPFIKKAEGGLSKNTNDTASKNPIPDGSGYHTNKGITWTVWEGVFGNTTDSIARFYAMSDSDWNVIFKKLFWDAILGDKINSQRIADLIVDWTWGSGKFYPEEDIQIILNTFFNDHLVVDGCFGQATIDAINSANEPSLWQDIVNKRFDYLQQIVNKNPSQSIYLQGWKNRMNNLIKFEITGIVV